MATEIHKTGEEHPERPDIPGENAGRCGGRAPYQAPCLRRLGNIADVTKGTGTGPGVLVGGFGAGQEKEQIRIYGDYSTDQVGSILNGPPENPPEGR